MGRFLMTVGAILLIPIGAGAQEEVAAAISVTPIYSHPRVMREPLRVAAGGSTLTVIGSQSDWIQITWSTATAR